MTSTTPPAPSTMHNEKTVAARYGIAVRTLRNWRSLGEGPRFIKLGKRCVRYREEDLAAFENNKA